MANEQDNIEVKGVITGKIPDPETEKAFKRLINKLKDENGLTFGESIKFIMDNILINGVEEDIERTSKIKQISQYTSMITTTVVDLLNHTDAEKIFLQNTYKEKLDKKDNEINHLKESLRLIQGELSLVEEIRIDLEEKLQLEEQKFEDYKASTLPGLQKTISDKEDMIRLRDESILEYKSKINELTIIKEENQDLKKDVASLKEQIKTLNKTVSEKENELLSSFREKEINLKEQYFQKEKELQKEYQEQLEHIQNRYDEKLTTLIDRYTNKKDID